MEILWYILAGIAGGVLGGMGMGGGTLLIPILTILLKVPQHTAQLINLASFIPMSAVALFVHIKNKYVVVKGLLFIIIPAIVIAVFSSNLAVQAPQELLSRLFGGFLALLGVASLFTIKKKA
jgi:uncharacterized membrane protein YfcA